MSAHQKGSPCQLYTKAANNTFASQVGYLTFPLQHGDPCLCEVNWSKHETKRSDNADLEQLLLL